ncbi:hypothetical protein [Streptomyces sp. NPDC048641]|uniref:hypothetical protein n=1 Tax=Streptomyces sp. NPDC048641 TaxID=3154825 RepID=UPI00341481EE
MLRLRLQIVGCPRRAIALSDTPLPDCATCEGAGGIESYYDTGEYAGSDWDLCPCWTGHQWLVLPLPRRPRWTRRTAPVRDPWADEPPF